MSYFSYVCVNDNICAYCGNTLTSAEQVKQIQIKIDEDNKYKINAGILSKKKELEIENQKIIDEKIKEISEKEQKSIDYRVELLSNKKLEQQNQLENEEIRKLYAQLGAKDKEVSELNILNQKKQKDFDEFKKKIENIPNQTRGMIGEGTLHDLLKKHFPEDDFKRQDIGHPVADIVQTIIIDGHRLKNKICYDNKENTRVRIEDCQKAKSYMETHNTEYAIIVSSILPKDFGDSMLGMKEGVVVAHPLIIPTLAKIIRKSIINHENIVRIEENKNDNKFKLFEYITSTTFDIQLKKLFNIKSTLLKIQQDEEKALNLIWTKRRFELKNIDKSLFEIAEELSIRSDKQFSALVDATN